jgi:hypothetical protein
VPWAGLVGESFRLSVSAFVFKPSGAVKRLFKLLSGNCASHHPPCCCCSSSCRRKLCAPCPKFAFSHPRASCLLAYQSSEWRWAVSVRGVLKLRGRKRPLFVVIVMVMCRKPQPGLANPRVARVSAGDQGSRQSMGPPVLVDGHLIIMTTRHIELVDGALMEPSRVAVKAELPRGQGNDSWTLPFCLSTLRGNRPVSRRVRRKRISEREFSPAEFMSFFASNFWSPVAVISGVENWMAAIRDGREKMGR